MSGMEDILRRYQPVIGLEVHVELKTKTKIFCKCANRFGSAPNTNVCPVCLGLPGALPVFNKQVRDFAIKSGLALNCEIAERSNFDRKHYFYPDLSRNYQITQFFHPICLGGYIDLDVNGVQRRARLHHIHMEEDAGKLVHAGASISDSEYSMVDYNRVSTPLLEIVGEPDLRSGEEAVQFLEKLKAILEYLEVSDCKMQEGSLRCDANVSIMPIGSKEFGVRTETKNLNSFKAVEKAINYEIARHADLLDNGGRVQRQTRSWDDAQGVTIAMRDKEEAQDYRYFPDPYLPPVVVSRQLVEELRATLPELPEARKARLVDELGLPAYDAGIITSSKAMCDYFDACYQLYPQAKPISNWIMGDLSALLNANGLNIAQSPVKAEMLVELLKLIEKGTISGKIAKTVFEEMFSSGKAAADIVKEKGLEQVSDAGELAAIIAQVIEANPKSVEDFRSGKEKAIGFLVGQVMKLSKGKANPGMVNEMLREALK